MTTTLAHPFTEYDSTTNQVAVRAYLFPPSGLLTPDADQPLALVVSRYVRTLTEVDSDGYRTSGGTPKEWTKTQRREQHAVKEALELILQDWLGYPLGSTRFEVEAECRRAMYPDAVNVFDPFRPEPMLAHRERYGC